MCVYVRLKGIKEGEKKSPFRFSQYLTEGASLKTNASSI